MIEIFIDVAHSLLWKADYNGAYCITEALSSCLIFCLGRSWGVSGRQDDSVAWLMSNQLLYSSSTIFTTLDSKR